MYLIPEAISVSPLVSWLSFDRHSTRQSSRMFRRTVSPLQGSASSQAQLDPASGLGDSLSSAIWYPHSAAYWLNMASTLAWAALMASAPWLLAASRMDCALSLTRFDDHLFGLAEDHFRNILTVDDTTSEIHSLLRFGRQPVVNGIVRNVGNVLTACNPKTTSTATFRTSFTDLSTGRKSIAMWSRRSPLADRNTRIEDHTGGGLSGKCPANSVEKRLVDRLSLGKRDRRVDDQAEGRAEPGHTKQSSRCRAQRWAALQERRTTSLRAASRTSDTIETPIRPSRPSASSARRRRGPSEEGSACRERAGATGSSKRSASASTLRG